MPLCRCPAPVPIGLCIGELLLPENQHHLQPSTPLHQQRQEHQQYHRQQWWCKVLQELPLTGEEVGAVAAAAGVSGRDADDVVSILRPLRSSRRRQGVGRAGPGNLYSTLSGVSV